ncbi:hypothetical protein [Bradyrhizobium zhanjiangense]|uniref:Uncharacterized protein n=1 Tax=Bradyrhizobium zhanjiangense TaxID=1325107 RepID=A0A4Q0RUH8_9BRAD|nr:hypothetical protein [Bradyrhizobium zhanjiangense]RXH21191.1 hypothetical protein XH94_38065 [Bradyrhizobium zhanjiangense]
MSTLAGALQEFRDTIKSQFAPHGSSSTIGFEIGFPLTVPDQLHARAVEILSRVANVVPRIVDSYFERGDRTLDGMYQILLLGSQSAPGTDPALFEAIKSQARIAFANEIGSLDGPSTFHPVAAIPDSWFNPQVAGNWSHHRMVGGDNAPSGSASVNPKLEKWLVAPEAIRPLLPEKVTPEQLQKIHSRFDEIVNPEPPVAHGARFVRGAGNVHLSREALRTVFTALNPGVTVNENQFGDLIRHVETPQAAASFRRLRLGHVPLVMAAAAAQNGAAHTQGPNDGHAVIRPAREPANFSELIAAGTTPKQVAARGVSIEFDLCVLSLSRPWYSSGLLALPNWFVPGFRQGDFSEGLDGPDNDGLLNAIPTACILTRDVRITANWTPADVDAATASVAVGPFSLFGRTFDTASGSLTIPGIQAVAWVCTNPKRLPPMDPP